MLGYEKMDGRIAGCMEYSGWVSFKVKVNYETSDFTIENSVRFDGQSTSDWKEQINVKSGDIVNFKLVYSQEGEGQQDEITIIDYLPEGLEYIVGSTRLYDFEHTDNALVSSYAPNADTTTNNITTKGLAIGSFIGNYNAVITFSAKASDASLLSNASTNTARVAIRNNGFQEDTTAVIVNKTISIHTPRMGCDRSEYISALVLVYFNPHTPNGV